ncbi:MAG: hypothetical protein R6W88_16975, partial [Desulfobacterales bacterium]
MKSRTKNKRYGQMIVVAVVLLLSTLAFAAEEELGWSQFDMDQTLLAGMTPDYHGIDTADRVTVTKKEPAWSVGAGVGIVPDYEGSEDYEGVPLLFVRAAWNSGRYVQFLANT